MISDAKVYNVYFSRPDGDKFHHRLVAKFAIIDGEMHHLCDYSGILSRIPEGRFDQTSHRALERLVHSDYYQVVSKNLEPERPQTQDSNEQQETNEWQPTQDTPALPEKPKSVFVYKRAGMDQPHLVEFIGQDATLDGNKLEPDEIALILDNARSGVATLRYQKGMSDQAPMMKSEVNHDFTPGIKTVKVGHSTLQYQNTGKHIALYSVRTPNAHRGQGSARTAIQGLLDAADQHGLPVKLASSPLDKKTDPSKLHAFYQSMGFTNTGVRVNPMGDPEMVRPVKGAAVAKSEAHLMNLMKAEGLAGSMEALRALVDAGHLHKDHYDKVRRELFEDEMTPGLGNKRSMKEHMENEGRGGVHAYMDLNGLKALNDTLGHEHGDSAIKAFGGSVRSAIDKSVGSGKAKAHRLGGDEFHVWAPDNDSMHHILRQLNTEMDAVPHIGGVHKLSTSVGLGLTPAHADQALYHAKEAKNSAIKALGGNPNDRYNKVTAPHAMYTHSLLPGQEGAVPNNPHIVAPVTPPAPETANVKTPS